MLYQPLVGMGVNLVTDRVGARQARRRRLSNLHYFYQLADLTDDCVQEIGFDGQVISINPRGLILLEADNE